MTAIKDAISDISKNVIRTGLFDKIKITATNKKATLIESIEKDKNVILKGSTVAGIDGLSGEFGLANLNLLTSIANDSDFSHKDSTVEVVTQNRGGNDVPVELHYTNCKKSFINYRVLAKELIPDQPKYSEPAWDLRIKPTKLDIQQFAWAANTLTSYEPCFIPKTVDGDLKFFIGEENNGNQRGGVVFSTGVTGNFETNHKWPISYITDILKLTEGTESEMMFSVKGAIQIVLNTGISEYKYIFPAKMR